jgi:hypothetical protein
LLTRDSADSTRCSAAARRCDRCGGTPLQWRKTAPSGPENLAARPRGLLSARQVGGARKGARKGRAAPGGAGAPPAARARPPARPRRRDPRPRRASPRGTARPAAPAARAAPANACSRRRRRRRRSSAARCARAAGSGTGRSQACWPRLSTSTWSASHAWCAAGGIASGRTPRAAHWGQGWVSPRSSAGARGLARAPGPRRARYRRARPAPSVARRRRAAGRGWLAGGRRVLRRAVPRRRPCAAARRAAGTPAAPAGPPRAAPSRPTLRHRVLLCARPAPAPPRGPDPAVAEHQRVWHGQPRRRDTDVHAGAVVLPRVHRVRPRQARRAARVGTRARSSFRACGPAHGPLPAAAGRRYGGRDALFRPGPGRAGLSRRPAGAGPTARFPLPKKTRCAARQGAGRVAAGR